MSKVRLVHGTASIREELQSNDALDTFPYRLNRIGYTMLLVVGALFLAGAGYVWWDTALGEPLWTALFAGGLGAGLALGTIAAYWYSFVSTHFLAVSPDRLYVGDRKRMWAIDWSVLDRQTLGFDQMSPTAMRGDLELDVGGQQINVHLYNAYAHLDDIQSFMFQVLKKLQDEEE